MLNYSCCSKALCYTRPMKKILSFLFLFALIAVPFARAEEDIAGLQSADGLVDLRASRNASKVEDLVRRVTDLERESKSQTERIRNLERAVGDLKRRQR